LLSICPVFYILKMINLKLNERMPDNIKHNSINVSIEKRGRKNSALCNDQFANHAGCYLISSISTSKISVELAGMEPWPELP
jgi:hypothetical protein